MSMMLSLLTKQKYLPHSLFLSCLLLVSALTAQTAPKDARDFQRAIQDGFTAADRAVRGAVSDAKTAWQGALNGRQPAEVQGQVKIQRGLREAQHAAQDVITQAERILENQPAAALLICATSGLLALYNLKCLAHNLQQTDRSLPHWLGNVAWRAAWLAAYGLLCYKTGQILRTACQ